MSEYHDHRDDCPFKFATLDVCDCVEKNMLDRIEALTKERDRYFAERNKFQLYLQRTKADLELEVAAVDALNTKLTKAVEALRNLHGAVCGETGFAAAVRAVSGKAYPWPRLDQSDAAAIATLEEIKGETK